MATMKFKLLKGKTAYEAAGAADLFLEIFPRYQLNLRYILTNSDL